MKAAYAERFLALGSRRQGISRTVKSASPWWIVCFLVGIQVGSYFFPYCSIDTINIMPEREKRPPDHPTVINTNIKTGQTLQAPKERELSQQQKMSTPENNVNSPLRSRSNIEPTKQTSKQPINTATTKITNTNPAESSSKPKKQPKIKFPDYFFQDLALASNATVSYPHIPWSILEQCGLDKHSTISQQSLANQPLKHSIAYVKPHKTGSSTAANLMNRILYGRGGLTMVPGDRTYLGWPKEFPGDPSFSPVGSKVKGGVDGMDQVLKHQKYNGFTAHSVFTTNRSHYDPYLEQPIKVITILRDPMDRTLSAYNYFKPGPNANMTWKKYIQLGNEATSVEGYPKAVRYNNMAFSLGWYHQPHIRFSTKWDKNVTAIQTFLDLIDTELDSVLILENMEESLALLKHQALPELDVSELVWVNKKQNSERKEHPTETERQELNDLLFLDRMIYHHFETKLERQWKRAVKHNPELQEIREGLKCAHDALKQSLDNRTIVPEVSKFFLTDLNFVNTFMHRQTRKYGSLSTE